jgi:hypothetical protein
MWDTVFYDDNYGYSVQQSTPSLPSGWSLTAGLKDAVTTATDLFGAYLGVKSAFNNASYAEKAQGLDLLQRSASIDISRTMTAAQVDIARAQANAAVKSAQRGEANAGYDLSTILGNVNARIAGLGSGNTLMLWLAVAGVGIAALQYFKGRS